VILHSIKQDITHIFDRHFKTSILIEYPKKGDAHLACPLFKLAKELSLTPSDIYERVLNDLQTNDYIERATLEQGFLNIYLDALAFNKKTLSYMYDNQDNIGSESSKSETIVIDYSSPNIAKRFSVGHIRSTVIGASLRRLFKVLGYQVEGINHLGDWGTQFGKMIYAYIHYGDEDTLKHEPIAALQKLYVKFHEEEKLNPSLADEARQIFKELEQGNETYLKLWRQFKDLSLVEFSYFYDMLGVTFDHFIGESFYESYMHDAVIEMEGKNILESDDDALIIRLDDTMPPALIKKKDGSTLYMTRDVAAAIYRSEHFKAKNIIYVVGNEQALHFKQLQAVLHKMKRDINIHHVNFGLVLQDGKKMSSRDGSVTTLQHVIEEAVSLAKQAIEDKNPDLKDKDQVAKSVAMGAIIFNDLKNEKHLNIEFNLANMLKFEGQTGPYVQYTSVRMAALLRTTDAHTLTLDKKTLSNPVILSLMMTLNQLNDVLNRAAKEFQPSIIARYALDIASSFNGWYGSQKMIDNDLEATQTRLVIVKMIRTVLNQCMNILGIDVLDYM
jgi:arginyl-tRNA synthetase